MRHHIRRSKRIYSTLSCPCRNTFSPYRFTSRRTSYFRGFPQIPPIPTNSCGHSTTTRISRLPVYNSCNLLTNLGIGSRHAGTISTLSEYTGRHLMSSPPLCSDDIGMHAKEKYAAISPAIPSRPMHRLRTHPPPQHSQGESSSHPHGCHNIQELTSCMQRHPDHRNIQGDISSHLILVTSNHFPTAMNPGPSPSPSYNACTSHPNCWDQKA